MIHCKKCNKDIKTTLECPGLGCMPSLDWDGAKEEEAVKEDKDNVNNPSHYGQGSIECIDYIKDFLTKEEYIGYLRGNIAKYLHRWRYKNGLEDLKKAEVYLGWLKKEIEEHDTS